MPDTLALARILSGFLEDERARATMGAVARVRAVEGFSVESMARGTVELYRACLHTGASRKSILDRVRLAEK